MEAKIQELIEISRFYGKNQEYVIAGGGNTSFKNGNNLWIKASGVSLANITEDGFVCLDREKLKIISEKKYSDDSDEREAQVKTDLYNAIAIDKGKRPSVETSLHNLVDYPFVIHTHPTIINSLLCSNKAKKLSFEILGKDILFIEYADPGYVLFKKVSEELKVFKKGRKFIPKIILLENHGIIVSGSTTHEIKSIYNYIEKKIIEKLESELPSATCRKVNSDFDKIILKIFSRNRKLKSEFITCPLIKEFIQSKATFQEVDTAFTPDHIVYCKSHYLFLENLNKEELKKKILFFENEYGYYPKLIAIKNKGLLIIDDKVASLNTIRGLILNMMKISFYARSFGGSKPLNKNQIAFIGNWEAENYRRQINTENNK
ncbi:MAG: class II aldolase [Bacteroidales bacterium]|nr:class II aldolase [Bacteroidales bacterium]